MVKYENCIPLSSSRTKLLTFGSGVFSVVKWFKLAFLADLPSWFFLLPKETLPPHIFYGFLYRFFAHGQISGVFHGWRISGKTFSFMTIIEDGGEVLSANIIRPSHHVNNRTRVARLFINCWMNWPLMDKHFATIPILITDRYSSPADEGNLNPDLVNW